MFVGNDSYFHQMTIEEECEGLSSDEICFKFIISS